MKKFKKILSTYKFYWLALGLILVFVSWLILKPKEVKAPKFKKSALGEYQYQAGNDYFTAYLADKSGQPKIKFQVQDATISFLPKNMNQNIKSERQNDKIIFKNIYDQTDLSYQTLPYGLKEELVLHSKPPTNSFYFETHFSGTQPKKIISGISSPVFTDEQGNYLFHLEPAFAIDEAGNRTDDVLVQINQASDDTYTIKLVVDETWLSDPDRAYPITIDPTIVHDESSDFASGSFNRNKDTGSGSYPSIESYYQELAADEHTVGLWHMNETTDNSCAGGEDACDFSGNGHHGTATGTTIASGKLSNARSFNGTSDHISMGDIDAIDNSNAISSCAWVYHDSIAADQAIIHNASGVSDGVYLFRDDVGASTNNDVYTIFIADSTDTSNTRLESPANSTPVNAWTHVCFTIELESTTGLRLYINGDEVPDSPVSTVGTSAVDAGANPFRIGTYAGTGGYFAGDIDEVVVSQRIFTPEEIKAIASRRPSSVYTSPVIDLDNPTVWNSISWDEWGVATGDGETVYDSTGLVAQWNFNETSGTTANNDAEGTSCGGTPANCDGTLTGFDSTASQDADPDSGWTANNRRWGAGALQFDGVDSYVSISSDTVLPSGTSDRSFSFWIKPSSSALGERIFSYGAWSVDNAFDIIYYDTVGTLGVIGHTNNYQSTGSTPIGEWSYVVITLESQSLKFYINGILQSTHSTSINTSLNSGAWRIGHELATRGSDTPFNGVLDSVQIYSRALPHHEIVSLYNSSNVELQTRVGGDTDTTDASWDDWSPAIGETAIESFDTSLEEWNIDDPFATSSTINKIGPINTGTGNDGDCIIDNGTKTLDTTAGSSVCNGSARSTAYAVNFSDTTLEQAGDTSVTVSTTPTGLAAGDEFIIINLQGTSTNYENVGQYETHIISSISTNTLNFTDYPLKHTYDGTTQKIMVQRVPNFGDVTVCGGATGSGCTAAATVTTSAWDGTKNGLLFFRSTGTTTINSGGNITASNLGFRGGVTTSTGPEDYTGYTANGGGTGGSGAGTNVGANGAGSPVTGAGNGGANAAGGYCGTTAGGTGYLGGGGGGGNVVCWGGGGGGGGASYITSSRINNPNKLFLGGGSSQGAGGGAYWGGGSVGGQANGTGANNGSSGNPGGGIISIVAGTITTNGSSAIVNNGGVGGSGGNGSGAAVDAGGGGGGQGGQGAAGGNIYLAGNSITLATSSTTALGGNGGTGGTGGIGGGTGGTASGGAGGTGATFLHGNDNGGNGSAGGSAYEAGAGGGGKGGNSGYPGNIYINYTSSISGSTTPVAYTQKLQPIIKQEGAGAMQLTTGRPEVDSSTVALYHLDETNGDNAGVDVFDATTNDNDGEFNGTNIASGVVDGINGKARSFNGNDDYIDLGNNSSLQIIGEITVEAWIKRDSLGVNHVIVGKYDIDTPDRSHLLYIASSNLPVFFVSPDGTNYSNASGSTTINVDTWYHIVGTYDLNTIRLYVNGILEGQTNYSQASINNSLDNTYVGQLTYAAGSNWNFDGAIDEVKISNIARSPEEIAESYRMGRDHYLSKTISSTDLSSKKSLPFYIAADRPGTYLEATVGESAFANYQPDTNTVGWWHLEDNYDYDNSIKDSSGNEKNGALAGIPFFHTFENGVDGWAARDGAWSTPAQDCTDSAVGSCSIKTNDTNGGIGSILISTDSYSSNNQKLSLHYQCDASARWGMMVYNGSAWSCVQGSGTTGCGSSYSSIGSFSPAVTCDGTWRSATYDMGANFPGQTISQTIIGDWNTSTTNSGKYIYFDQFQISSSKPSSTRGIIGQGKNFSGTSDYISIPTDAAFNLTTYTISGWFKTSDASNYKGIVTKNISSFDRNWWIGVWHTTGLLKFVTSSGGAGNFALENSQSVADGKWHHFAAVVDGTTAAHLYLDGTLVDTATSIGAPDTQSTPVIIGNDPGSAGRFFSGSIDEIQISSDVKTASEIRQAYEVGLRTHPITIDFAASLDSGNLIIGSGDLSFTVDATTYGLSKPGSMLFTGDKVIVKENYDGTEYIAQGTVTAISESTGATTVAAWDSGSTFPTAGYTANATVFKWQREYWPIAGNTLSDHMNAITKLTLRLTNGNEGRTVWLDDLKSTSGYLTNNSGSTITSNTGKQYFQYRAIFSSWDEYVSATMSAVTTDYAIQTAPNTPSLDSPGDEATSQAFIPTFLTTATDDQSDYLRYKIQLCENEAMTTNCQTFDQTSSQTGWTGQDAQTSTAYASGTQASYTLQSPLVPDTTYYWRSYAIDPAGTNTWSSTQVTPYSFSVKSLAYTSACTLEEAEDDGSITVSWADDDGEDGFDLDRSVNGGAYADLITKAGNITYHSDTTVSQGNSYQYRVRSYTGTSFGEWCYTAKLNLDSGAFRFENIIFN